MPSNSQRSAFIARPSSPINSCICNEYLCIVVCDHRARLTINTINTSHRHGHCLCARCSCAETTVLCQQHTHFDVFSLLIPSIVFAPVSFSSLLSSNSDPRSLRSFPIRRRIKKKNKKKTLLPRPYHGIDLQFYVARRLQCFLASSTRIEMRPLLRNDPFNTIIPRRLSRKGVTVVLLCPFKTIRFNMFASKGCYRGGVPSVRQSGLRRLSR